MSINACAACLSSRNCITAPSYNGALAKENSNRQYNIRALGRNLNYIQAKFCEIFDPAEVLPDEEAHRNTSRR